MASPVEEYRAGAARCGQQAKNACDPAERDWQMCLARAYLMLAEAETERPSTEFARSSPACQSRCLSACFALTRNRLGTHPPCPAPGYLKLLLPISNSESVCQPHCNRSPQICVSRELGFGGTRDVFTAGVFSGRRRVRSEHRPALRGGARRMAI